MTSGGRTGRAMVRASRTSRLRIQVFPVYQICDVTVTSLQPGEADAFIRLFFYY